ncbi:hypothetical protein PR048_020120 [Dryococelus australis]|uniref:DDE Tnp4 domain-containing protein n=1 Tax=Dryococelus australis TaxID=614101 RepID=A0ABQ9H5E0_9NEOP|nr:hypothetical protein PR048_020120 [Dryococelus australis]
MLISFPVFPGNMILNHVFELLDREGRNCKEMVKRTMVQDIVNKFQATEAFASTQGNGGYQPVSPEKHILAFSLFVEHQSAPYRGVADCFDITISTLHEVITRVIRYPTREEKEETKTHYLQIKGLPDLVGLVDGCHVQLDKPAEDKDAYVNRKHYFSVHLQGTVNEKRKFMDVFIEYPAITKLIDSNFNLCVWVTSEKKNWVHVSGDGHVLGDSAYPCLPQLIIHCKDNGHLTRVQRSFNRVRSSCRITVEHAFGCLKQHFRQLYHLKLRDMQRVVQLIHACCVLHNLADEVDLSHLEPLERADHPNRNAVELSDYRHRAGDLMPMEEDGDPDETVRGRDHQK